MPKIPIVFEPEPGELMYSYLWRLAIMNGLDHVSDLLNSFILPNKAKRKYAKIAIRLDANDLFEAFFNALDVPVDKVDFYLNHTIYAGIVPVLSRNHQANYIAQAFCDNDEMKKICGQMRSIIGSLNFCPLCKKEDKANLGFWYYHREHHMPGVKMCFKHKIPLITRIKSSTNNPVKNLRPFKEVDNLPEIKIEDEQKEYNYAVFMTELLNAQLDTDYAEVVEAIISKTSDYTDNGLLKKMTSNVMNREQMLYLISVLFDDVSELPTRDTLDISDTGEYKVISKSYNPLIEMEKNGERFITTSTGFYAGWREKETGKNAEIKFREMFKAVTDGTYHLLSSFKGMTEPIEVYHDVCQKRYKANPRSFLIEGHRCTCTKTIDAQKIMSKYKGFKLIDYKNNGSEPCTILHEGCGNTFKTTLFQFSTLPLCRRCQTIQRHSLNNINNLVEDLTGDEYEVIKTDGYAKGKITLRHNACGNEHTYYSKLFREGMRCPYCKSVASEEQFRNYVKEVSDGRYIIGACVDARTHKYEVIEGENVQVLKRAYILQELNRPTPSTVLPLKKKKKSDAMMVCHDVVWDYLQNFKSEFIFSDEIKIEGVNIQQGIAALIAKKKLFRAFHGRPAIYSFKDIKLTTEEAIELMYIERDGVIFGYYDRETLLYKKGLISEKPEKIYIKSNMVNSSINKDRRVNGININVKPAPVLITNDNYKSLQFISLCNLSRKYDIREKLEKIKSAEKYLSCYNKITQQLVREILQGN